jgi:hypothetical protein
MMKIRFRKHCVVCGALRVKCECTAAAVERTKAQLYKLQRSECKLKRSCSDFRLFREACVGVDWQEVYEDVVDEERAVVAARVSFKQYWKRVMRELKVRTMDRWRSCNGVDWNATCACIVRARCRCGSDCSSCCSCVFAVECRDRAREYVETHINSSEYQILGGLSKGACAALSGGLVAFMCFLKMMFGCYNKEQSFIANVVTFGVSSVLKYCSFDNSYLGSLMGRLVDQFKSMDVSVSDVVSELSGVAGAAEEKSSDRADEPVEQPKSSFLGFRDETPGNEGCGAGG